jgi:hypothetical protein
MPNAIVNSTSTTEEIEFAVRVRPRLQRGWGAAGQAEQRGWPVGESSPGERALRVSVTAAKALSI